METQQYKDKLLAEKALLEKELGGIAQKDAATPNDWDVTPPTSDNVETRDEVADRLEEMNERKATEVALENQLMRVNDALDRIANGSFGKCVICGKEIEADRLEVNPSATTCKEHRENE